LKKPNKKRFKREKNKKRNRAKRKKVQEAADDVPCDEAPLLAPLESSIQPEGGEIFYGNQHLNQWDLSLELLSYYYQPYKLYLI